MATATPAPMPTSKPSSVCSAAAVAERAPSASSGSINRCPGLRTSRSAAYVRHNRSIATSWLTAPDPRAILGQCDWRNLRQVSPRSLWLLRRPRSAPTSPAHRHRSQRRGPRPDDVDPALQPRDSPRRRRPLHRPRLLPVRLRRLLGRRRLACLRLGHRRRGQRAHHVEPRRRRARNPAGCRRGSFIFAGADSTGAIVVNRIARWDGAAWRALGTGVNGKSKRSRPGIPTAPVRRRRSSSPAATSPTQAACGLITSPRGMEHVARIGLGT